jgi:hypothetical protein
MFTWARAAIAEMQSMKAESHFFIYVQIEGFPAKLPHFEEYTVLGSPVCAIFLQSGIYMPVGDKVR